jgi:hypothetical protein
LRPQPDQRQNRGHRLWQSGACSCTKRTIAV